MSWSNRRGPSSNPSPAPTPPVQMYNPNQHSTQEVQWQQQPQNWYNPVQQPLKQETQPQANFWQQPQSYNSNPLQPSPYPQNASNFGDLVHGQAGNFQNNGAYGNVQYNQQYNQNNAYPVQPTQQSEGDAWNWGWGDENNSNVQAQQEGYLNTVQGNNLGDSFAPDETWNWSLDDNKPSTISVNPSKPEEPTINELFPKVGKLGKQNMKTEKESEVNKVARTKLETAQWSSESQVSQESSDDILHTSESDKSHLISRSSTISHSSISGQDYLPPQPHQSNSDIVHIKSEVQFDDLASNHQQFENKEIICNMKQETLEKPPKVAQSPLLAPPTANSDNFNNPYKRTGGISHKSVKPKTSNAVQFDSQQAFLPPVFHSQPVNLETVPDNSEHPDNVPSSTTTKQPNIKSTQSWPENNEAPINDRNQYLETGQLSESTLQAYGQPEGVNIIPEGSDILPPPGLRRMVPGQIEQNDNVGPRVFRNDPPPGLNRLVVGQTESSPNMQGQEMSLQYDPVGPPEGLRRMVPGESSSPETSLHQQNREDNDSESELDHLTQHTSQPRSATIGADTPPSVQMPVMQASATGQQGNNRSEAVGSGNVPSVTLSSQENYSHLRGASVSSTEGRKGAVGIDRTTNKKSASEHISRRESIEGETNENEITNLTSSVRNLTVGENITDGHTSNSSLPEPIPHKSSRHDSSDSESDHVKPARNSRDKRSMDRNKKEKDREKRRDYSPDYYKEKRDRRDRDKKYREKHYDDESDYYSDREKDRRVRTDRDREYEKKYSSLRKEKDRKKRSSRDPRDYHRDPRRGDYYNRYDDYNDSRSRPSSRSDSVHDSYRDRKHDRDPRDRRPRDRDRERDRYRHRDHRDGFNPHQGYAYDPYNPYYQQYQYFENLRRTNPQAYAEWYRKYYQQTAGSTASYTGDDRASVHSGRSSANDELTKDSYAPRTYDQADSTALYEDQSTIAQRLTPSKFAAAHIKASLISGKLICIHPNYPMDGQNAIVDISNLHSLLEDNDEFKELNLFPGPLVRGTTHKKTIIEYCENKIKSAAYNRAINDIESYVLMWELLILLLRQNGMVVGTDIAELLLKNSNKDQIPRAASVASNVSSNLGEANLNSEAINQADVTSSLPSLMKEEEVTNRFREYLLYGSGKEALEWAMKHGLWGHALFLASKLDKRTYANVMMRFANGLTLNDPLQTLYQLLSGKMPAAVTCVSDEKWGDWRPHLAMILSNSTQRPELNFKAITNLGDTLLNRGSLYAAQFCYLMAQVGFGTHDNPKTKLVLLGSDHHKPYPLFATNEAIHMTEIYEYACSLNDQDFIISDFQVYKYLLATRLADRGLLEKSLLYLEKLSDFIVGNPSSVSYNFVDNVFKLSDKLKFYDPIGDAEDESEFGGILETSRPDNSWLKDLKAVLNDYQCGTITHQASTNTGEYQTTDLQNNGSMVQHDSWQQQQQQQQVYDPDYSQQAWQPEVQPSPLEYSKQETLQQQQNDFSSGQYQDQQSYWANQQSQWPDQSNQYIPETIEQQQNYYGSPEALGEPQKEVQKDSPEVSNLNSPFTLSMESSTSLRKRLTTSHVPSRSPTCFNILHGESIEMQSLNKNKNLDRYKKYSSTEDSFDRKSSSLESSDAELETFVAPRRTRTSSCKSEEKSHLISHKDKMKVVAVKSESKLTRYSTFDMKYNDKKNNLVKYKSLDIPEAKSTTVKYLDPQSKVSISAENFDLDFRKTNFGTKRTKPDIITDTVDAWAKKTSSKNVFSSLKNSLFHKSNHNNCTVPTGKVIYKPLIFGGTYPIDCPIESTRRNVQSSKFDRTKPEAKDNGYFNCVPKIREYGPPKTFNIDEPI